MSRRTLGPVRVGFEETTLRVPIDAIVPLREVSAAIRRSIKYGQIAASIAELGIIEPPAVVRDSVDPARFHLLDGHLRVAILRERGETEVVCLVAIDDEAFTYNKRISRVATIQEHKMILNAIKKGVPEERLARALNVDIGSIRTKRDLLIGICPEVATLLRDRHVPINVFAELRRMKAVRQVEAAQAMITTSRFTLSYARSLVAATPGDQLLETKRRRRKGMSEKQIETMQRESENLDREFKLIEQDFGADHVDLMIAAGFVTRLLGNARIVNYLAQHHGDLLSEFHRIVEFQEAA